MRRSVLLLAATACLLLTTTRAEARRRWETFSSNKFKIQFDVPRGMAQKTWNEGRWGGFKGTIGDTTISLLAFRGKIDLGDARQLKYKVTGIPARFWTLASKGDNWNGFARYRTYTVTHRGRMYIASVLRHANRFHHYIVFIETPTATFNADRSAFEKFSRRLKALP